MAGDGRRKQGVPVTFVASLAAGRTVAEAAQAARISERTAYRLLADPAVKAEVVKARGSLTENALGVLCDAMRRAAEVLDKLLNSKTETTRLAAARSIIQLGVDVRSAVDMEARFVALEVRTGLRAAANTEGDQECAS